MLRKLLAAVFAATLMAGSAWGATLDVYVGGSGTGNTGGGASEVTFGTGGAGLIDVAGAANNAGIYANANTEAIKTAAITIGDSTNGTLYVGRSATGADVTTGGYNSAFTLNLAGGATLNAGTIDLANGVTVKASTLTFDGTNGGTLEIADGSTFIVNNTAAQTLGDSVVINLDDGTMQFASTITISGTGATVAVTNADSILKVGKATGTNFDVTVGADSALSADAVHLDVMNVGDAADYASVNVTTAEGLAILNSGSMKVGALQLNTGGLVFKAGSVGALEASSLVVANDTTDNADVDTHVTGLTTINATKTYIVLGDGNAYDGGIDVKGTLQANSAATKITVGTVEQEAFVNLYSGSSITFGTTPATAAGFTIDGGVKIIADTAAPGATIDISGATNAGLIITKDFIVEDDVSLKTDAAATSVIAVGGDYIQTAGTVTQTAAATNITVTGAATIGGAGNDAEFILFADNDATTNGRTLFDGGLTIGTKGALTADGGAARELNIGDDTTLILAGGTINAGALGLTLDSATGSTPTTVRVTENKSAINTDAVGFTAANSTLEVDALYSADEASLIVTANGGAGAQFADVKVTRGDLALINTAIDVTTGDVVVEKGAWISSEGASAFTASAGTKAFNAKAGSVIDSSAGAFTIGDSVGANDFAEVTLDGKLIMGMDNSTKKAYTLVVDSAAFKSGNNTSIELTAGFAAGITGLEADVAGAVNAANTIVDLSAVTTVDSKSYVPTSINNIFGQFGLAFGDAADTTPGATGMLYVKSIANPLLQDGSEPDRYNAMLNLQNGWAPYGAGAEIDQTLANAVYDMVATAGTYTGAPLGIQVSDPELGGRLAIDLLADMAHPDTSNYTQGVGKTIFRNGDVSETLTSGLSEIRGVSSAIGVRNTQLRGQMAGANDVYYEYANPSLLLNNDYANRIWAGYLGQWEKADSRNGVGGYDYDSHGFIIGYDRLVGCNFAFGGAFAYTRGDYEDKTALSNDSKIDNYSFNGYATYSALNGVFASLFGGYTHQQNEIGTTYRGGATGVLSHKADYDSDYWNIGGQLGYDFQPVDGLVLTPSIGLQYIHGTADSHSAYTWNSPTSFFFSTIDDATQEALLLPIEIAAKYTVNFSDCSRLTVEGNLGYSYNFINSNTSASMAIANVATNGGPGGDPVFIDGYDRDAGRHTFNAGAGLRYTFNRFDIGLKYDYYLQQDAHAHRVMGSVGVSF